MSSEAADRQLVRDQAKRLRACKFYSHEHEEDYLAEIEMVLRRCTSDAMVVCIVNDWLKTSDERPTPADFTRLVNDYLAEESGQKYYEPLEKPPEMTPEERAQHNKFVAEMEAKFAKMRAKSRQAFAERREKVAVKLRDTGEDGPEGSD